METQTSHARMNFPLAMVSAISGAKVLGLDALER